MDLIINSILLYLYSEAVVIVNSNEIRKGIATEGWFTVFNGNENLGRTETSNVFLKSYDNHNEHL